VGKSATFDNDFLKLVFNATAIANLADNAASSPLTSVYVALHTADPSTTAGSGTLGTQNASEATYTGYTRVAVVRTTSGWTVTGASVSPAATISFPPGTGGSGSATFASVGVASSGATKILYSGALTPAITMGNTITPQIGTTSTITES
jgi:hypothetical protein